MFIKGKIYRNVIISCNQLSLIIDWYLNEANSIIENICLITGWTIELILWALITIFTAT